VNFAFAVGLVFAAFMPMWPRGLDGEVVVAALALGR
jgi:hypothetical protein